MPDHLQFTAFNVDVVIVIRAPKTVLELNTLTSTAVRNSKGGEQLVSLGQLEDRVILM
jgi:hypothetical protein